MGRSSRQLSAVFDHDGVVLCLCLAQARTPDVVLVAKASGFDAVYVDLQHTVTPLDVTSMLCAASLGADLVPLVRVPSLDGPMITRVLDGGALGVIAPNIETVDEAAALVAACRFPPVGHRSLYAATPATAYTSRSMDEHREQLDNEIIVAPQIESALGVENVDKIAATDGLDMILVGAYDLSVDLGVGGQLTHPALREALLAVASACSVNGRRFGVAGLSDPALLAELVGHGLGFISAGTDVGLLQRGATARVAELRDLTGSTAAQRHEPPRERDELR